MECLLPLDVVHWNSVGEKPLLEFRYFFGRLRSFIYLFLNLFNFLLNQDFLMIFYLTRWTVLFDTIRSFNCMNVLSENFGVHASPAGSHDYGRRWPRFRFLFGFWNFGFWVFGWWRRFRGKYSTPIIRYTFGRRRFFFFWRFHLCHLFIIAIGEILPLQSVDHFARKP